MHFSTHFIFAMNVRNNYGIFKSKVFAEAYSVCCNFYIHTW